MVSWLSKLSFTGIKFLTITCTVQAGSKLGALISFGFGTTFIISGLLVIQQSPLMVSIVNNSSGSTAGCPTNDILKLRVGIACISDEGLLAVSDFLGNMKTYESLHFLGQCSLNAIFIDNIEDIPHVSTYVLYNYLEMVNVCGNVVCIMSHLVYIYYIYNYNIYIYYSSTQEAAKEN